MIPRTFFIETLGCKVNRYEAEQVAALLRQRGLRQVDGPGGADLRVINTCSVTTAAAAKSRHAVRRATRLPVLGAMPLPTESAALALPGAATKPYVLVMGCWATSDGPAASSVAGVDAVLGHQHDIASEVDRLLHGWETEAGRLADVGQNHIVPNRATRVEAVNYNPGDISLNPPAWNSSLPGTVSLPVLDRRQDGHQRAVLKIQDGCDAHCTYCIIPSLRSRLWSKPIDAAVDEARRLVDCGHQEIVLTGIFLGAYGQATALRRRQTGGVGGSLGQLVEALCQRVPGLVRLRLSSLEPGDLSPDLLGVLRAHAQVVPHFHLPLQSGSDAVLRSMNRQYTRDQFLRMLDVVRGEFDRPALTTDVIVGFPGETDDEFSRTLQVVDEARFVHTHAFPFSPRPGTAAARWQRDFVRCEVVDERIATLRQRARQHSHEYRQQFLGQEMDVMVELPGADERDDRPLEGFQHGRCSRYFAIHFASERSRVGEMARVRIDRVTPQRTWGIAMDP